jgi:hypothetical protein
MPKENHAWKKICRRPFGLAAGIHRDALIYDNEIFH